MIKHVKKTPQFTEAFLMSYLGLLFGFSSPVSGATALTESAFCDLAAFCALITSSHDINCFKVAKVKKARNIVPCFWFRATETYFLPLAILVENSFPALNLGTFRALILITSPV